jgi:hypothetical protein
MSFINVVNIMSCEGFTDTGILGGCSQAWFALLIVFFLILVLRRQTEDGAFQGSGFSFIGALIAGMGLAALIITLFGDAVYGIIAGLIGIGLGGFLLGKFIGAE